jgi:hypothetical protein
MAIFNQDPPNQATTSLSASSVSLVSGSTEGTVRVNYKRFQQDGTGPTYFMNIEISGSGGGGGGGSVPTTGQIWPRGLN